MLSGDGDTFTLSGFFTTGSEALTYSYQGDEFLVGLSDAGPHLALAEGFVFTSEDFDPPVGPAYFKDTFGSSGYLGPVFMVGPTTTDASNLRTFVVPGGTPYGIYPYSYGVTFNVNGEPVTAVSDPFTVEVVTIVGPEPSTMVMLLTGLSPWILRKRRKGRSAR